MKERLPFITKKPTDILIVAKQNKVGLRMANRLENHLKNKVHIHYDPSTALKFRKRGISIGRFSGDLIISLGGDGTLLRASHQTTLPVLPVKLEGHGFLCTATFRELIDNIDRILEGNFHVKDTIRLGCSRVNKRRIQEYIDRITRRSYPPSLNEIVFARKRPSKILEIDFKIDNNSFRFAGDGLMISTPHGSTAYASSAGGSLIDPVIDAINVIPLYPFYSHIKPMIIPSDKKIEIDIFGECGIVIDGHEGDYVKGESSFIVEKGEPMKIVHLNEKNFYKKFSEEFM